MRKDRLVVLVFLPAMLAALVCLAPTWLLCYALLSDTVSLARTLQPALRTAIVMIVGGVLCTVGGLAIALYIFYFIPEGWKASVDTALFCAAGISPVVFVILTITLWRGRPDSWALYFAIMLCQTARAARHILGAFTEVSPALIDSARALGMTGFRPIRKVLIPSSMRGIIGTAFLTISRVGALAPVLNMVGNHMSMMNRIGNYMYLTELLALEQRGQVMAAAMLLLLCVGFFVLGNHLTGRWKNV